MSRALDPARPVDDAFLDAVLGLDSFCRALGVTLDDAIQPGRDPVVRAPDDLADDLPDDLPHDLIDALLGLISVRTTVALVVAAASSASARVAPAPSGSPLWSREQLR